MKNTIALGDWFSHIDDEYLSSYIKAGGSSVKIAVTTEESKPTLYDTVSNRCEELGYEVVKLDAKYKDMRAYMPQDIFFGMAKQLDWRQLARRCILKLAYMRGFNVANIDPTDEGVFDNIADANHVGPQSVIQELRPEIANHVTTNPFMAKDFRVCMSHLCLMEYNRGDYNGQLLLDWVTGLNTRISNVRDYSIYSGVNRTTARYFIESALYWVRFADRSGTVILFDNSRVTVARNPKDEWKYYSKPMTLEHYELLRQFIDRVDEMDGLLLLVVTNLEFLDESPDRRSRGYGIYPALQYRVMADVRDQSKVNPLSSLVRLS